MLEGLPPEARIGIWVFEWYWVQPEVPHVKGFVANIRKVNSGKVPTALTCSTTAGSSIRAPQPILPRTRERVRALAGPSAEAWSDAEVE